MRIGMIGLGRMGGNMARRLLQAGHECVLYDTAAGAADALAREGGTATHSLQALIDALPAPRALWLMVPAAVVNSTVEQLLPLLEPGDVIIDGGNSDYRQAIEHAQRLGERGMHFIDVGTSGGVWGLERGYCLMMGGEREAVQRLQPIFDALAPGQSSETRGNLYCGGPGAGHFVKMIHNGIEYALMAAYAEGFNLLAHAGRGHQRRTADAETAPLSNPTAYQYDFDLPAIAALWGNGSVIRSWLLELTAQALKADPALERFVGHVSDSGEGRWTLQAAIDLSVPMPTLASALFGRFSSRNEDDYANRLLSAMREQFGGHKERSTHEK